MLVVVLSSLKGAARPWMTNWLFKNDMSILVSEAINISIFPKTASVKNSILFLIEYTLICLIMTLFRLFALNLINLMYPQSYLLQIDRPAVNKDCCSFWVFKCYVKQKQTERMYNGIKFLMSEFLFTLLNFLTKFTKFLANWIVPKKFNWCPFLPIQQSVICLLSITSIL